MECLVVDDCSNDDTVSRVRDIIGRYDGDIKFRIISRPRNGGLSAARNAGIREATGDYLLFVDGDDLISDDCVERFVKFCDRYPDVEFVVADFATFPVKGMNSKLSFSNYGLDGYYDDARRVGDMMLYQVPIMAWNKLVRRDIIVDNNLFFNENLRVHEDDHWRVLVSQFFHKIGFVNAPTYLYRQRELSLSKPLADAEKRRFQALCQGYRDLFSREDIYRNCTALGHKTLIAWQMRTLNMLRFDLEPEFADAGHHVWKELVSLVLANNAIPAGVKAVYRYYKLPRPLMKARIASLLLKSVRF